MFTIVRETFGGFDGQMTLLGVGQSETKARIAAYQNTNGGSNLFDTEFEGGICCRMAENLADLEHESNQWDEESGVDDNGNQYWRGEAPDALAAWNAAICSLYIKDGVLVSKYLENKK